MKRFVEEGGYKRGSTRFGVGSHVIEKKVLPLHLI